MVPSYIAPHVRSSMSWGEYTMAVVRVTPQLAAEILKRNTKNRKPREVVISAYTSDMERGNWKFTGDAARFHKNGTLIDAQHRMMAIEQQEPGFSLPMLMVFGLGDDEQLVMDQGAKRSAADQLRMLDFENESFVAAVTRQAIIYDSGLLFRNKNAVAQETTISQIGEWVETHPEEVAFLGSIVGSARKCNLEPKLIGLAALLFSRIDAEQANDFVHKLATGAGLQEGSAILALRERLIKNRMDKRKDSERDSLGLLIKAWNYERAGKRLTRMQLPNAGSFTAETFPVPR